MAVIEPVKQNPLNPAEIKKYTPAIRLWHWLNLLVISGSLITVLINSTLLDRGTASALITSQGAKAGATISPDAAKQIAHELEDSVWNIHACIGLVLAALLLYRIVYEITRPASQSLFRKIKLNRAELTAGGEKQTLARHDLVVKIMYAVFYAILTVMAVTGVLLFFKHELNLPKGPAHQMQEVHGACMYAVILFILVHIAGVIMAERKQSPGIVSDMINGGHNN